MHNSETVSRVVWALMCVDSDSYFALCIFFFMFLHRGPWPALCTVWSSVITLESSLSFDRHIAEVCRSCHFHIRAPRHIRPLLTNDSAISVASSIVSSRLDYCNSLLCNTTQRNLHPFMPIVPKRETYFDGKSWNSLGTNGLFNCQYIFYIQHVTHYN